MSFFRKLFLGKPHPAQEKPTPGSLQKRLRNLSAIWNNEHDNDMGIEKILRLFLAISQFFFPGVYIKQFFGRYGKSTKDLIMDLYVLCKVALPLILLRNGWDDIPVLFWVQILLLAETLFYVPTLMFASDLFGRPRSYRRSMLLLFFNYLEIVGGFAVLYAHGNYLNRPFQHWFDPVYFSFVTSVTIGYGDLHPVTFIGKILISFQ